MPKFSRRILSLLQTPARRRQHQRQIRESEGIDTSQIETLCLTLGPYRNLTTLTASMLFLHPECQVLNHGGTRILGDPRLDFLGDYDEQKFHAFLRFAIHISGGGGRGKQGGSIMHSHAFDSQHPMAELYRRRFGERRVKPHIRSLFWKESLRTAQHIRRQNTDLDAIFSQNRQLRFLLPVRNPMDCALSNQRTGHAKLFGLGRKAQVSEILAAILDEFRWFLDLQTRHPDRFLYYFENDFDTSTVQGLADFLKLSPDPEWQRALVQAFAIQHPYAHDPALVEYYRRQIGDKFAAYPEFSRRLHAFLAP